MAELKWVAERCQTVLLPALRAASIEEEIKQICFDEIAFWHTKAGTPNSLRTPHTQSRNIVRVSNLPEEKKAWALQHLSLGEEKWIDINRTSAPALAVRLENQILLQEPDRIVAQAETLLESSRWQDLAAGLALVTGRRSTEILKTAQFEECTAYSVVFTGQLKHDIEAFEIPTLTPARKVLDAFARLRALLNVENQSVHEVSNSYHKAVTASVRRHFETLISESVSTHTMRAVYTRLAIFFFAPVLVDADTYAAEISGHRSRVDSTQRSYGAGPNYSEYKIADRDGQIDGRQGVKLNQEGVEVLSVFSGKQGAVNGVERATKSLFQARLPQTGLLAPESLFTGEMLQLVRDGMKAAEVTDFLSYLTTALKRQAKNDLGLARRDTVADVQEMSMEDLLKMRKHSTANERIRRAIVAIEKHNEACSPLERWFVNATVLSYLIGGRFQTILDYLAEHKTEVDNLNNKYNLTEKYNRKPVSIKDVIVVE